MAESNRRDREVLSVLFQLIQRINQGAPLEDVLREIAAAASRLTGAEAASVMLLDEARTELLSRASHGLPPEEAARISFRMGEGIAGWVAEHDTPVLVADATGDARFKAVEGQTTRIRSICCVPLTTRDGVIGVLSVNSDRPGALDEADEELLRFLAASLVRDLENARLYRLAVTDGLTRAYNRQYLSERLPIEMERHRRYADPLSVVLIDADHFKAVNDTHGHPTGDQVLRRIAHTCMEVVREVDIVVRYGGEEFLLVLPQTDAGGAALVAERVRARIEDAVTHTDQGDIRVTVSLGVAEMAAGDRDSAGLIARADAALYDAKASGRNRVVVAPA